MRSFKKFCTFTSFILSLSAKICLAAAPDCLSEWNYPLSQFEQVGSRLAERDGEEAKNLVLLIKTTLHNDPGYRSLTKHEARKPEFKQLIGKHAPYDFNRLIPQFNPQIFLNASLVYTPEQEFILTACPRIPEQVTELFMHFLNEAPKKRVWVSVLDSSEKSEYCNNFWKADFVKTLPLRNGWHLVHHKKTQLAQGDGFSAKGTKTELIQTTLVFSNGQEEKTLNHLHYNGWFDGCRCPDESLFIRLLEEMRTLNKQKDKKISSSEVPIYINCVAGIGRTGMTAVGYLCYKKINACPSKQRSEMTLNIPAMIYELRKQRGSLVTNYEHLSALYSFFGRYYSKGEDLSSN